MDAEELEASLRRNSRSGAGRAKRAQELHERAAVRQGHHASEDVQRADAVHQRSRG